MLVIEGSQVQAKLICCNQGRVLLKSVNANPGLKVNRDINFSRTKVFFTLVFCVASLRFVKLKTED